MLNAYMGNLSLEMAECLGFTWAFDSLILHLDIH